VLTPNLDNLDPDHGMVGDTITLNGSNFGSSPGTIGYVDFNGIHAGINSWSDTQILVTVPDSTNGNVIVHTGGGDSGGIAFTYIPHILALNPDHGVYERHAFTIQGAHFGDGSGSSVTFNGNDITGSVTSWTETEIVAAVPQNIAGGDVYVTVNGYDSNHVPFTIDSAVISSLNPNTGSSGETITINGANFGASRGDTGIDYVTFNGVLADGITSWNNSEIVVTVPNAETGNVIVHTIAGDSNGVLFTFVPNVDNIYPDHGYSGCYVVVTGTRFGFSGDPTVPPPDSSVTFNGVPALRYVYWSPTVIACVAPIDVSDGPVDVIVAGLHSATTQPFTVLQPQINVGLQPNHGVVGDTIAIYGDNFGYFQGGTGYVMFNSSVHAVNYLAWDNSQIVVQVPSNAVSGDVFVHTNGGDSPGVAFSIDAATLDHTLPASGVVGDTITVYGLGFGATQDSSYVTFYPGVNSPSVTAWNNNYVVCTVPEGAESGGLTITTAGGMSNNIDFIINTPVISSLEPDHAQVGSSITINGSGFGASRAPDCFVSFNGTHAVAFTSWTNAQIIVTVPAGATTGNVIVHTGGGDSNGAYFTVEEPQAPPPQVPPVLESLTPDNGVVGTAVTIAGSNFGAAQGTSTVTFNGVDAGAATTWSDNQIIINVPAGATTGAVVVTVQGQASNNDKIFTVNP
jgi:hypothetical protein